MNRRVASSVALLAVPFLLTACGGKKGGGGSPAATPPANEQPAPAATSTPTATETDTDETTADDADDDDDGEGEADAKTTEVFQPKHTPASFALTMPGAISISLGGELRLQDEEAPPSDFPEGEFPEGEPGSISEDEYAEEQYPDPEGAPEIKEPGASESHGLAELSYQVESIESHVEQYSRELSTLDVALEANATDCFDDDGCDLEDVKGAFTQEMANKAVEDLGGPEAIHPDDVAALDSLVGSDIELGSVSVRPSEDERYTWTITIDDGAGRTLAASWKQEEVDGEMTYPAVSLTENSAGSWSDETEEGEEGEVHTFSVSYNLQFNSADGSMRVTDESEFDGQKYNNTFFFLADADSDAGGASFAVDISSDGKSGDGSFTKISGYADNAGAYLQTIYAFDNVTNTLTLDGTATAWTDYGIYPTGTLASELAMESSWELQLGSFMADSDTSTITQAWYMGPLDGDFPDGGLPLITTSYDPETGEPTFVDAGINVTAVSQDAQRFVGGYTEMFSVAGGELDGDVEFCYYELPSTTLEWPETLPDAAFCTGGFSAEGGYADIFADEVGADGIAQIGQVVVGIGGAVGWLDVEGADLYFVAADDIDQAVLDINAAWATAETEDDDAVAAMLVGSGTFVGLPGYDYGDAPINDYYVYSPWASVDVLVAAKVAKLVFNPDTGAAELQLLSLAEIVAFQVTEDNAETSIEDKIEEEAPIPQSSPSDCNLETELYDSDASMCRAPVDETETNAIAACSADPGMVVIVMSGLDAFCSPL